MIKIIFKYGDGIVIMEVDKTEEKHLIWNEDFQKKIDSFVIPNINEDYTDIIETATKEQIDEFLTNIKQ